MFGRGEHPEIFLVTLDPARNPAADYLRGTFDWHLDGVTDDVPIMATVLSAHQVAESGGDTEFSSTYAAFDDLSEADQERYWSLGSSTASRPPDAPPPRSLARARSRCGAGGRRRRTRSCGGTARGAARWCSARPLARRGDGRRQGKALLADLLARSTTPERIYRHEWSVGDMVIWDNRGVLHRPSRYDPSSPRDMHRTTIAGDEPIQ